MEIVSLLIPIFICVVLPIALVYIVFRSNTNRDNKRAEILIKAIEINNGIDTDKLAESLHKPAKTPRELLNIRLLRGCMFTLIGIALGIFGICTRFIITDYNAYPEFFGCAISSAIGISYLIVYFVTCKQIEEK